MASALSRHSWRQLSRHRGRTTFTLLTLVAAVVGVWLFAAPRNFDAEMNERVESDVLHDAILRPNGVLLDERDLATLRSVPGIEHLDARATHVTEMRVGDVTSDVWLVGVEDFSDQRVNVVDVDEGRAPVFDAGVFEAMSDPANSLSGIANTGAAGDTVMVRSARSGFEPVAIVGEGTSVYWAHNASEWIPVLYVPVELVWEFAPWGHPLFTQVEFSVAPRDDASLSTAVDAVRDHLADVKPAVQYNQLVEVRPVGEWPGEDDFDNFLVLFWVIAGVSLVSALALVASTMTTLMREQASEIAIMKSVGGRRRRIIGNYLSTSALLGFGGTVFGCAIGYPLATFLTSYLGRFQGVEPGWRLSWLALWLSVAVGVGGTVLASLPALWRGTRITVRDGLRAPQGDLAFGGSAVDRFVTRARWLPRTAQLGLRAWARRKTRSVATQLQIALAVGTLLGFGSLAITMIEVSEQSRLAEGGDIELYGADSPGRPLDDRAARTAAGVSGVDRVQPTVGADVLVGDTDTFAWGLPADPVFAYELSSGRWFTEQENEDEARVAVVGPALATVGDIAVGDAVRAETLAGPLLLEVVGIDSTLVGDGLALFVPIDTVLSVDRRTEPSWFWITTDSRDTADIDRVATDIRAALDAQRYAYELDLRYLERAADRQEDRTIVTIIFSLGVPVVAMGMIGLVSAMTTNVVERRREVGVLRSIGARARDIRRIFLAEAVVLVVLGWLMGIAVGYVIARIIIGAMSDAFDVSFDLRYPLWPIGLALLLTLFVGVVVVRRPLRRAARLAPSEALRYE